MKIKITLLITLTLLMTTQVNILAVEPNIDELPSDFSNIKNISLSSLENSKKNCDLLVILVGHKEFTNISGDNVLSWTKI